MARTVDEVRRAEEQCRAPEPYHTIQIEGRPAGTCAPQDLRDAFCQGGRVVAVGLRGRTAWVTFGRASDAVAPGACSTVAT